MRRHLVRIATLAVVMVTLSASAAFAVTSVANQVQVFNVPSANAGLEDLVAGPDGNLWFTEENAFKVGRLTTGGQFSEYPVPANTEDVSGSGPWRITSGSDGDLWFSTDVGETIDRMDTNGNLLGTVYEDRGYNAANLTWGDNGSAWLFEAHGSDDDDAIIHLTPNGSDGYSAFEGVPDDGFLNDSYAMATAPDGTVYFNEHNQGDYLNSITDSGSVSTIPVALPQATQQTWSLAVDSDGTPWFTVQDEGTVLASYPGVGACCGMIGHVVSSGVKLYPVGAQTDGKGMLPQDIIQGPGGTMWFSFLSAYSDGYSGIGEIDNAGQLHLIDLSPYKPTAIAFGGDGDLYFIDSAANSIGKLDLGAASVSTGPVKVSANPPALTVPAENLTRLRSSRVLPVTCALATAGTCSVSATVPAATARKLGLQVAKGAKTVRIATARGVLKQAGTAKLRLRLGAGPARHLSAFRTLQLKLVATVTARGAQASSSTKTVTLKR